MHSIISEVMNDITQHIKNIIGDNLVGIYLHGSAAFGCFNPLSSDIDFIAVTRQAPDLSQKKDIIGFLMDVHSTIKGVEMSFVLEEDCKNFVYPTPYQLHFSEYHRKYYTNDIEGHINRLQGTDKDLAAHFTVINSVGITWHGKDKSEVFSPVPCQYYLDSIKYDIESASEDIYHNPVYIILNLCRVYAYIQSKAVLSKADGGIWGMENIPVYKSTINKAYNEYLHNIPAHFSHTELEEFAQYMIDKIFT